MIIQHGICGLYDYRAFFTRPNLDRHCQPLLRTHLEFVLTCHMPCSTCATPTEFLPFLLGAAQLRDQQELKPRVIHDAQVRGSLSRMIALMTNLNLSAQPLSSTSQLNFSAQLLSSTSQLNPSCAC